MCQLYLYKAGKKKLNVNASTVGSLDSPHDFKIPPNPLEESLSLPEWEGDNIMVKTISTQSDYMGLNPGSEYPG